MSRSLRVVHLPARTPYVRKITSPNFTILNGTNIEHGIVPDAVSAQWLLDRRPLDWLDVLHIHQIEFDDFATLARLFTTCEESSVKIVYTAHDASAMYRTAAEFRARMDLLCQSGAAWIGLTERSIEVLRDNLPDLPEATIIPHGFVVHPNELGSRGRVDLREPPEAPRYLLYGALRTNRDYLSTIANWSLSIADPTASLNILMGALSPSDFDQHDVPGLLTIVKSDKRIKAKMCARPTDDEVATAGIKSDALLLPYLFGSHSGQLELAFDLNLLPICSSIGYLKDQYDIHKGLVGEPVWFDWGERHPPFLSGEKFVAVLESTHARLTVSPRRGPSKDFLEYRRYEYERFLDAHNAIYSS